MAESNQPVSIYQPLATEEIRLMKMHHEDDNIIKCTLSAFSVHSMPESTRALSYCWTKEKPSHGIELNGAPFLVRPNLYSYLELMRKEKHEHWIFVDALCIDQDNVEERGHQISHMGLVFENAAEVIVWLGTKADKRSCDADGMNEIMLDMMEKARENGTNPGVSPIDTLWSYANESFPGCKLDISLTWESNEAEAHRDMASRIRDAVEHHLSGEETGIQEAALRDSESRMVDTLWNLTVPETFRQIFSNEVSDRNDDAKVDVWVRLMYFLQYQGALISAFLQRSYWGRVWIVQEVALARDLMLRFRNLSIHLDDFGAFIDQILQFYNLDFLLRPSQAESNAEEVFRISLKAAYAEDVNTEVRTLSVVAKLLRFNDNRRRKRALHHGQTCLRDTLENLSVDLFADIQGTALVPIISAFSEQQCALRYDIVFGVQALVNSQITADYRIPRLTFYMRILSEGLLEYKAVEALYKETSVENSDHPYLGREIIFCSKLLNALDLDIYNLVVALVTCTIWAQYGGRSGRSSFKSALRVIMVIAALKTETQERDSWSEHRASRASYVIPRFRAAATMQRLKSCKRDELLRSPCGDRETRSMYSWIRMASDTAAYEAQCKAASYQVRSGALTCDLKARVDALKMLCNELDSEEVSYVMEPFVQMRAWSKEAESMTEAVEMADMPVKEMPSRAEVSREQCKAQSSYEELSTAMARYQSIQNEFRSMAVEALARYHRIS